MRRFLLPSVLLLGLLAGCSGLNIGPHRIDVQQGNALDQENVARLKPGLTRSQVRFLLGTPLVVDPFRTDRWDYVYVFHKAGKLAEQKRMSLFFDGDTLVRIEGELPEGMAQTAAPDLAPTRAAQASLAAEPVPLAPAASPGAGVPLAADTAPGTAVPVTETAAVVRPHEPAAATPPAGQTAPSSIVPPLPSPRHASPYVDPRTPAEPALQPATDVTQLRPDVIPPFPEPRPAATSSDDPVLRTVTAWADAWGQRDEEAYLAAYDVRFVPAGGDSRIDWEKRRRLLLGLAKNIEVRIDSPSVERHDDGSATVTFNQFYRSDRYRDAVVKQLRLVERDGRWRIIEEKVLSILREAQQ
ncbi:MAG: outer membrane protein assembly factor BamE [Gammaproteobacteria bacterium]